ncbi:hypothetical protein CYY_004688 [Polysphondylium violaceum]|uniref:ILEI/PANDER domain-containing protein n=1 Tax=Polysphondylium violaceum TaxID=133409 RepID=A0A8J4USU0_9MYCE|nr:hypothetical protein CYY_004688 [Polysphondylium violaceum]
MPIVIKLCSATTVQKSFIKVLREDQYYPITANRINMWVMDQKELLFPFTFNSFDVSSAANVQSFMNYVDNIKIGCSVMVIIVGDLPIPQTYKSLVYSTFQYFGGSKISNVSATNPNYCLIGYKGQPVGQATEVFGKSTDSLSIEIEMEIAQSKSWNTKTIQITTYNSYSNKPTLLIDGRPVSLNISTGMNVITFNKYNQVETIKTFNTNAPNPAPNPSNPEPTISEQFSDFLDSIDESALTLIFTYGETKYNFTLDNVNQIKKFGSKFISDFYNNANNKCWYLFGRKEDVNSVIEATTTRDISVGYYFYTVVDDNANYQYENDDDGNIYLSVFSNNTTAVTSYNNLFIIDDIDLKSNKSFYGFVLGDVDENDGTLSMLQYFDIPVNGNEQLTLTSVQSLVDAINAIPTGNLAILSASKLPSGFTTPSTLTNALYTLGSCSGSGITGASSFSLIGRKGSPSGSAPEDISTIGPVSVCSNFNFKGTLVKPFIDIKVVSYNNKSGESEFYINGTKVPFINNTGMNVLVVDSFSGTISYTRNFNTIESEESDQLSQFIESLPVGSIVGLSSQGTLNLNERAKKTISNYFKGDIKVHQSESNSIYTLGPNDSYCSIGQILDKHSGSTSFKPLYNESFNSYVDGNGEIKTTASLRYPLKYLFDKVEGHNINVQAKSGSNALAKIEIDGSIVIGENGSTPSIDGLNIVTIRPDEITPFVHQFNVIKDQNEWFSFFNFINNLSKSTLVIVAVQEEFGKISDPITEYYMKSAFRMIGGSLFDDHLSSFAMIGCKGIASSSAHELRCKHSSFISISSWEPKRITKLLSAPFDNKRIGRDAIFAVPLFEEYYKLSNPTSTLPKQLAIGHKYSIPPAFSQSPRPRIGATPIKRALIVSCSYVKSLSGRLSDAEYHAQQHAQALITAGYLTRDNIKILSESTTEPSPSGYIGPNLNNIKSQINWLQSEIVAGDSIYFCFVGRGWTSMPWGRTEEDKWYGGLVLLTQSYVSLEFFYFHAFQALFNKVVEGINLSYLFDCDYSHELAVYNSGPTPPYPWNINAISSLAAGKMKTNSQLSLSFLECINTAISEQYNNGGSKLTYSQLVNKVLQNPSYLDQSPTYEGPNPNLTFLNPLQ